MYIEQPYCNPKDVYGNYIYGLENLYKSNPTLNSADLNILKNSLIVGTSIGKDVSSYIEYPSIFLNKFLDNSGGEYWYDSKRLGFNYLENKARNMNDMICNCKDWLSDDGTIFIATSDDAEICGLNIQKSYENWKIGYYLELNDYTAIGDANAVFVTELSKKEDTYYYKTRYYLLDYYDFDPTTQYEPLYRMNTAGIARNFLSVGFEELSGTVDKDGTIKFEVKIVPIYPF